MGVFFLATLLWAGASGENANGQESSGDAVAEKNDDREQATEPSTDSPNPENSAMEADEESLTQEDGETLSDGGKDAAEDDETDPEREAMEKERLAELAIRLAAFRENEKELRKLQFAQRSMYVNYVNDVKRGPAERKQYYDSRIKLLKKYNETYDAALRTFRAGFDQGVVSFLMTWVQNRNATDIYNESTFEGAARMLDSGARFRFLFQAASRSAVVAGEFASAKRILSTLDEDEKEDVDLVMEQLLDKHEEYFLYEKKIRAEEAELELPQVRLQTTRGDVLIELYLNQAPSTVAHFIGLVEQGFYDDCDFYQVVDHLVALTGDPGGTGDGNCGKFLIDEHENENARKALRGSLAMAKIPIPKSNGKYIPNSASSQFAITLLPILQMSESQTIFGRVIEGMDAVCRMRRVDPSKEKKKGEIVFPPDRIIEATVVRRPETLPEPKYVQLPGH